MPKEATLTKTRTAHCTCRQLQVEADGDRLRVNLCHCTECQRRTGSPFGIGAWYSKDRVSIRGETKTFVRPIEDRNVTNHFCPTCGGTVLWEASKREGLIAIAVGMSGDPGFPPPARSIFEVTKHPWRELRGDIDHLVESPPN
jgi:hypothetical protein